MAAVAALAVGGGAGMLLVLSFALFTVVFGIAVFGLAYLGSLASPAVGRPLRLMGRRIQAVGAIIMAIAGGALIYTSIINPMFFDRLILPM